MPKKKQITPNIEAFEKYSKFYDEWFENNKNLYKAELKTIKELLPSRPLKGLEVGVGSAKFAKPLHIKIGIEPSKKMAKKAKKAGIKVYKAVAEDLPFKDSSFDFVLMVTTICFISDISKAFSEIFRVLKKNGFVIIAFVDKDSLLGKEYLLKKDKSKFYSKANFFGVDDVKKLLRQNHFKIKKIRQLLIYNMQPGDILKGYGKGSFVAIKAKKRF